MGCSADRLISVGLISKSRPKLVHYAIPELVSDFAQEFTATLVLSRVRIYGSGFMVKSQALL